MVVPMDELVQRIVELPGDPGSRIGLEEGIFVCPHCRIKSQHKLVKIEQKTDKLLQVKGRKGTSLLSVKHRHLIYRCVPCNGDTYFLTLLSTKQDAVPHPGGDRESPEHTSKLVHQFPISMLTMHKAIPRDVREATIETEKCFAIGAYNGCGTMARRAIDAMCQHKKAKGEDLYHRLKWLKEENMITPDLWQWAEELRIVGRDGAHPEWQSIKPKDAQYAVNFLREILRYIYINPSERAARRFKESSHKKSK